MSIDHRDGGGVGDGDMTRLDANELSVPLVGGMDGEISAAAAGLDEKPEARELCRKR